MDRAIMRAHLRDDPLEHLLVEVRATVERLESIGQQPIKPEIIRQAIRSSVIAERWRHLIIACAVGGGLMLGPAAVAGYYVGWRAGFVQSCIVGR